MSLYSVIVKNPGCGKRLVNIIMFKAHKCTRIEIVLKKILNE